MLQDQKAKRRLLKIVTNEVSLVGVPANQQQFLVTKNTGDESMPNNNDQSNGEDVAAVAVSQEPNGSPADVAKALEGVNAILNTVMKAVGKDEPSKAEKPAEETEMAAKPGKEPDAMMKAFMATGMDEKAAAKACAIARKFNMPPMPPVKKEDSEGDTAADGEIADAQKSDTEESNPLEAVIDALQKGARFTPPRVQKLKEALELLKLVMEGIGHGEAPKAKLPSTASFGTSGVKKGDDEQVTKALAQLVETVGTLAETVKGLGGRVDDIENARPPSNSLEGDGGTDSKATKKSTSMWAGTAVHGIAG